MTRSLNGRACRHSSPISWARGAAPEDVTQRAAQVREEERLMVRGDRMAHRRVEGALPQILVTPRDWMVRAHPAASVAALVDRRQDMHAAARIAPEVVPFVDAAPQRGQRGGGGVAPVDDIDRGGLYRGVAAGIGADEPTIEGPGVLSVAGGVDAEPPAAAADESLQRAPLRHVEHRTSREHEGHRTKAA